MYILKATSWSVPWINISETLCRFRCHLEWRVLVWDKIYLYCWGVLLKYIKMFKIVFSGYLGFQIRNNWSNRLVNLEVANWIGAIELDNCVAIMILLVLYTCEISLCTILSGVVWQYSGSVVFGVSHITGSEVMSSFVFLLKLEMVSHLWGCIEYIAVNIVAFQLILKINHIFLLYSTCLQKRCRPPNTYRPYSDFVHVKFIELIVYPLVFCINDSTIISHVV